MKGFSRCSICKTHASCNCFKRSKTLGRTLANPDVSCLPEFHGMFPTKFFNIFVKSEEMQLALELHLQPGRLDWIHLVDSIRIWSVDPPEPFLQGSQSRFDPCRNAEAQGENDSDFGLGGFFDCIKSRFRKQIKNLNSCQARKETHETVLF